MAMIFLDLVKRIQTCQSYVQGLNLLVKQVEKTKKTWKIGHTLNWKLIANILSTWFVSLCNPNPQSLNRPVRGERLAVLRAAAGVRAGAGHVLPDAGRGTHGQAHQAGLPPARQEQEPEAERSHHRSTRHGLGQTG